MAKGKDRLPDRMEFIPAVPAEGVEAPLPLVDSKTGVSLLLVELSDVLPSEAFQLD